LERNLNNKLR